MRSAVMFTKYFLIALAIPALGFAADAKVEETASTTNDVELAKVSEAFGHLIGKNLDSLGLNFDMKLVMKGIEDSFSGKQAPMSEADCIQAITTIQELSFQKACQENLSQAEAFLTANCLQEGIIALEEGKIQYKRLQEGTGAIVEEHFTPMIRYVGRFLDGKVFGESQEEELISLDETIPGFQKAIVGMKEGEKREIFIHPDLAYGVNGYMPPNSLLKFEIEIVKANVSKVEEDGTIPTAKAQKTDEIAGTIASETHLMR
ncbi:MAG: FKBP-type peptidyl-prolyl cis-trans isomerase [Chlamydiae bacterium]|nr:FKBP-type peptidyl-prolyl cis-trans isomerase [Chlamydiota bacterium]